jgi:hypothetical protein
MSGHAGGEIAGAIGISLVVASVLTTLIWQFGATIRARAALAREQEYRRLAEKSVAAQEAAEQRLGELTDRLGDIRSRVDSLDRILKQVD